MGGGVAADLTRGLASVRSSPAAAPWSAVSDPNLGSGPVYSDIEDTSIGGNLGVIGLQSYRLG
jgi:hypothetical protein